VCAETVAAGSDSRPRDSRPVIFFPAYSAPEVMRGSSVSPAADIFSFGVLVLEMFTRARAYGRMTSTVRASSLSSFASDLLGGVRRFKRL
jgi:serine/threonine protein kinase